MLYWIAHKAKDQTQEKIQNGEVSWYATTEEITEGLASAWGVCKVRQEVNAIIDMGIIGRDRNRQWGADRTKHFVFGKEQCATLLKLCQEHNVCLHAIGLSADVVQMINLSNASDEIIICKCGIHQMQMINLSNGHAQANDKSIRAITKDKDSTKVSSKGDDTKINLSSSAQSFYSHWITLDYPKEAAKVLDAKLAEQCEKLAPDVTTREELISLCEYCLKMLPTVNDGKLWGANLIKWVEDWKKGKSQQQVPDRQEEPPQSPSEVIPRFIHKLVDQLSCDYHFFDETGQVASAITRCYRISELSRNEFLTCIESVQGASIDGWIGCLEERFLVREESVV
jgi:hypothetical protein